MYLLISQKHIQCSSESIKHWNANLNMLNNTTILYVFNPVLLTSVISAAQKAPPAGRDWIRMLVFNKPV